MEIKPKEPVQRRAVTVREFARMVGVSNSQAYKAVNEGWVRSVKLGRRFVIPLPAVDEFLNGKAPEQEAAAG